MKKMFFAALLLCFAHAAYCQSAKIYMDSIGAFRSNYVNSHEVITTKEARALLQFFPIDPAFQVKCRFQPIPNSDWFPMPTTSGEMQIDRKYGKLDFTIGNSSFTLFVYQSKSLLQTKDYRDYLFVPFTDKTNGASTYGAGRYLDCKIGEISDGILVLDFNKAYNPYCAYQPGYSCPIPPKENDLPIAIMAGEKIYGKAH
jgi:uncharacterized protein (DUF1684 family)